MSVDRLYQAVKSGQIRPEQLNEKGKAELRRYLQVKRQPETYGDSSQSSRALQTERRATIKQEPTRAPAVNAPEVTNYEAAPNRTLQQEKVSTVRMNRERAPAVNVPEPGRRTTWLDIPANAAEGFYDSVGFGMLQDAQRRINNLLIAHGKISVEEAEEIEAQRNRREDSTSYKVGQFAGYLPPGVAIERGVGAAAKPIVQNLPRWQRYAATGAAAGGLEALAQEGADVAFREDTFDPLNILLGTAAGGALGAAAPVVGDKVKAGFDAVRDRVAFRKAARDFIDRINSTPPDVSAASTGTRAVRRVDGEAPADLRRADAAADYYRRRQAPTIARPGRPRVNVYRQKYDRLIAEAQRLQDEGKLPPGREWETLQTMWGRMAEPEDPGLDELITLAFPSQRQRNIPEDLIRRARNRQASMEAAGIEGPLQRGRKGELQRLPPRSPELPPQGPVAAAAESPTAAPDAAPPPRRAPVPRSERDTFPMEREGPARVETSTGATAVPDGVQAMTSAPIPLRAATPGANVKPITRKDLIGNIRKRFGVTIRTGRLGKVPSGVLGIHKVKPEVIRSRYANDIQVIAHELGHNLDKRYGLKHDIYTPELENLVRQAGVVNLEAYDPEQIVDEGVAEFLRLYLTDPAMAQRLAPRYSKFFETRAKDILPALRETQADVARWIDQGEALQFEGQINRTGKDTTKTNRERFNKLYSSAVDKFYELAVAEKSITGKISDASESLYKKARLAVGAPKKAQLVLEKLQALMKPLDSLGYSVKDLGNYAAAKHADELEKMGDVTAREAADSLSDFVTRAPNMQQVEIDTFLSSFQQEYGIKFTPRQLARFAQNGSITMSPGQVKSIVERFRIESGFTRAQIDATIAKYQSPEMDAIQKSLVGYNNMLLDMLVEGGVLSKEARAAMQKKYPNYVPFFRFFDEDVSGFAMAGGGRRGFTDIANPIKRLKGSTRDIIDPIESIVKNTFAVVNAVEKNKVGLELARLSQIDGAGRWVEKLDGAESVPKENIVTVFENGKKVQYQLDPELFRAMKELDEESSNMLIKILAVPSSMLRAGATLTPEFLLRNPIRDQFQAFVVSEFGYNPIIDLPLGLWSVIKKRVRGHDPMYDRWVAAGGGYGNYVSMDRNYLREQLQELRDERNPWARRTLAIVNPKAWIRLLQSLSEISEEATKVGEFRRGIRKGATDEEAAYQARDLMDFGRVGSNIRQINRVVTFLNANLQGKDRIARAFNTPEKATRSTIRALTAITLPTVGIYLWNRHMANEKQRDTLNNAPQWLRDSFFLISIPGTDVVARIPKPFDLAPVFANLPENIMRWMDGNDPQSFEEFAKSTGAAMSVPYMLTGLTPWIENMTNYNFFTGGPVVPKRDQDLLPEDQYGPTTSLTAKTVGGAIGYSPYKVDNLIQGYGAGLGRYATWGMDQLLEALGAGAIPPEPEKNWSEMPVVNAFTVDTTGGGKVMDEFYDVLDELTKQEQYNKKNDVVDELIADLAKDFRSSSRDIGELRNEYREIQSSMTMSPAEKRRRLDALNEEMKKIARAAVAQAEAQKVR